MLVRLLVLCFSGGLTILLWGVFVGWLGLMWFVACGWYGRVGRFRWVDGGLGDGCVGCVCEALW